MKKIVLTFFALLCSFTAVNAQPIHIPATGTAPMLARDGVQVDREWFVVDDFGNVVEAVVQFSPEWNTDGNGSRWVVARGTVTPGTYARFRAFFYVPETYDLSTAYFNGRIMFSQTASLKINNQFVSQLACGNCGFRNWLNLGTNSYFWPNTSALRHGRNQVEVLVENPAGVGFGLRVENSEPLSQIDRTTRLERGAVEFDDDGDPEPGNTITRYFTLIVPDLAESECVEKTVSFPEASNKYSMSAQMVDGAYRRSVGVRFARGSVQLTICAPHHVALPSEAFTVKVIATPIKSRRRGVRDR